MTQLTVYRFPFVQHQNGMWQQTFGHSLPNLELAPSNAQPPKQSFAESQSSVLDVASRNLQSERPPVPVIESVLVPTPQSNFDSSDSAKSTLQ